MFKNPEKPSTCQILLKLKCLKNNWNLRISDRKKIKDDCQNRGKVANKMSSNQLWREDIILRTPHMRHWWESSRYRTDYISSDARHNPIEANTHKWCYLHTAMMMMRYRQSCWTKKLLPSRWTLLNSSSPGLVGLAEKARNNMCDKSTYWPCSALYGL